MITTGKVYRNICWPLSYSNNASQGSLDNAWCYNWVVPPEVHVSEPEFSELPVSEDGTYSEVFGSKQCVLVIFISFAMLLLTDSCLFLLKLQIRYLLCQPYLAWPLVSPSGLSTSYPRVYPKYCLFHWVFKAKASSSCQFPLPPSAQHSPSLPMPLPFYSALIICYCASFSTFFPTSPTDYLKDKIRSL